jgi:hypothetical protein
MSVKRNVTVPVGSSVSCCPFGARNGSYAPAILVRCPGLAIAAVAAPAAQARVDEGIQWQPNSSAEIQTGIAYQHFVTDFPSQPAGSVADMGTQSADSDHPSLKPTVITAANKGTPRVVASGWPGVNPSDYTASMHASRAMPHDPALTKGDQGQPRSIGEPQVVSASFDWKDAGIGAGLALALLLLLGGGAVLVTRHVGREQAA